MRFTGEQVVLGQVKQRVHEDHVSRYEYIEPFVKGKVVLDIACGSGYGTKMIKEAGAQEVYGVDLSKEALDEARKNSGEQMHFLEGNVASIPCADKMFDVAVTFETIEHVNDETRDKFLRELHRVLKDDGLMFLSTPNRRVVSPYSKKPLNQFHVREYLQKELVGIIERSGFIVTEVRGQRILSKLLTNRVVRKFVHAFYRFVLRRPVDLYLSTTPPEPVLYDVWHEPRCYFITAKKA